MKSQLSFNAILFAIIAIVGVMVLLFGVNMIGSVKGKAKDIEIKNFVLSLQNMVDSVNNYGTGSVREFSYILPEEINKICLNDGSEINKLVDSDFNSLNRYYKDNLYLFPGHSFKLEGLALEENPLCFNVIREVNVELIKKEKGVGINVPNKKMDCSTVIYNGDEEEKLDIVFLADDYKDLEEFKEDIDEYINYGFYIVEPFKSNKKKINFFHVNEFKDLGCENIKSNIICDSSKVKDIAIRCPNDYIIVLSKNKIFSSLRSTTYNGIIAINTADNKLVIMHEIGHLIGDLADEYIVRGLTTVNAPNCDLMPCSKWDKKSCFKECSSSNYYRSTKDSLMRAFGFGHNNNFGFLNEEVLLKNIEVYE